MKKNDTKQNNDTPEELRFQRYAHDPALGSPKPRPTSFAHRDLSIRSKIYRQLPDRAALRRLLGDES